MRKSIHEKRDQRRSVIESITTHYKGYQTEKVWADYDRRLSSIPTAQLATLIDEELATWEGMAPPKPAAFLARWFRKEERRKQELEASGMSRAGSEPWPGGMSPDGSLWCTVAQAQAKLVALRRSNPDAFDPRYEPRDGETAQKYSKRMAETFVPRPGESAVDFRARRMQWEVACLVRRAYEATVRIWGDDDPKAPEPYQTTIDDEIVEGLL